MEFPTFVSLVKSKLPQGTVLQNPGGGTTTIKDYNGDVLVYRRRNSDFRVALRALYGAFITFQGGRLSSAQLRDFAPHVFDSKGKPPGHSCNCTLLYMLLREIGTVERIRGAGVRGAPFYVDIPW